jgi:hypothetical protein
MRHLLLAFSFLVVCSAQAQAATFMCPARPSDTCFFVVFGPNFQATPFELRGGDSKQISNAVIGRDSYCYKVNEPVPSNCQRTPVSDRVNQ